jgi:sec-independent protein translocase protein TatA
MESIGWPELLVIGIVFLLLFGTKKIPEAAKGLGEGIRNFKASLKGESEAVKKETQEIQNEIEKV